jgi:hypothetical protein
MVDLGQGLITTAEQSGRRPGIWQVLAQRMAARGSASARCLGKAAAVPSWARAAGAVEEGGLLQLPEHHPHLGPPATTATTSHGTTLALVTQTLHGTTLIIGIEAYLSQRRPACKIDTPDAAHRPRQKRIVAFQLPGCGKLVRSPVGERSHPGRREADQLTLTVGRLTRPGRRLTGVCWFTRSATRNAQGRSS